MEIWQGGHKAHKSNKNREVYSFQKKRTQLDAEPVSRETGITDKVVSKWETGVSQTKEY